MIICTAGLLLGDAFMVMPAVRNLCARYGPLRLVCGQYDAPVFRWAAARVRGCVWEIVQVLDGFASTGDFTQINAAADYVRNAYPGERIISSAERAWDLKPFRLKSYYGRQGDLDAPHIDGEYLPICCHPYTMHTWKNCGDVVRYLRFGKPVQYLGLADEPTVSKDHDFFHQADAVARCDGFVGVLSGWTNLAILFRKPMIIASFTKDKSQYVNPNMTFMVNPDLPALQGEVDRRGWGI